MRTALLALCGSLNRILVQFVLLGKFHGLSIASEFLEKERERKNVSEEGREQRKGERERGRQKGC